MSGDYVRVCYLEQANGSEMLVYLHRECALLRQRMLDLRGRDLRIGDRHAPEHVVCDGCGAR